MDMERLRQRQGSFETATEIAMLLAHVFIRQYRRDALIALKKELPSDIQDDETRDKVPFTLDGLRVAFGYRPYLVTKSRSSIQDPDSMFNLL